MRTAFSRPRLRVPAGGLSRSRPAVIAAAALGGVVLVAACERQPERSDPAGAPTRAAAGVASTDELLTTFYPSTYFAERLVGGKIRIRCVTPPDADPASFRPDREQIASMQTARLIVLNGAGFEQWARTASLPPSRTVELSRPLAADLLEYQTVTHSHGPTGAHSHKGIDGHTWMDPVQAQAQARELARAISAAWPEHASMVEANLASLISDLEALDSRWRALAPALATVHVLANHQAYSYPARRYGFRVVNLDVPPEQAPSPEQWLAVRQGLEEARRTAPGRSTAVMLFEEAPLAATAERLRTEFGIVPVEFPPGEQAPPGGGDYLELMRASLERLATQVGRPPPPALKVD